MIERVSKQTQGRVCLATLTLVVSMLSHNVAFAQISWAGSAHRMVAVAGPAATMHLIPADSVPIALASHMLDHEGYRWMRNASDHVDLYYLLDSYSFELGRKHRYQAELARTHALEILGEPVYEDRLSVFYLDSSADMRELIGAAEPGRVDLLGNAVALVVDDDVISRQRHDIMHVLSWGSWGIPVAPYGWISEGLAVFAQGGCGNDALRRTARSIQRNGALLPTDSLVYHFQELQDAVAYVQAASLVNYVHEEHGVDVLRELWRQGVGQLIEVAGLTLEQLDAGWKRYLALPDDEQVVALQHTGDGC